MARLVQPTVPPIRSRRVRSTPSPPHRKSRIQQGAMKAAFPLQRLATLFQRGAVDLAFAQLQMRPGGPPMCHRRIHALRRCARPAAAALMSSPAPCFGRRLLRRQDHRADRRRRRPAAATTSTRARWRGISAATFPASRPSWSRTCQAPAAPRPRNTSATSRRRTAPRSPASCRARSWARCSTTAPRRCSTRPRCATSAPPTAARASASP